jgi:hypothetical protein
MENEVPSAEPTLPIVLCPHCRQPLDAVGWLHNPSAGILTFYHNVPTCMVALNFQALQVEQPRIQLPRELMPRGRG